MPLSDSELKGLKAGAKRKVVSAGDSLFVVVESVGRGGGNSSGLGGNDGVVKAWLI